MQKEFLALLKLLKISISPDADTSNRMPRLNGKILESEGFNWIEFEKHAEAHSVTSLIYDLIREIGTAPDYILSEMGKQARGVCLYNYRFLMVSRNIVNRMEKAGIGCCVLKGAVTAGFYPVPALRKAGDIDILLPDEDKSEEALGIFKELGFLPKEEQLTNHHIELENEEHIVVELHTMLTEPFDNNKINRYLERLIPVCGRHIITSEVMGVELPMLDYAFHAYELLLHMLQHYLRSGFGLKLLCDWVVFWNSVCGSREEDDGSNSQTGENAGKIKQTEISVQQKRYLRLVKDSGLKGFSDMITAVCVRYLGLKYSGVKWMQLNPKLLRCLKNKAGFERNLPKNTLGLCQDYPEDDIDEFLNEILEAGEFGKSSEGRMVALRGSGIPAYFREFHHQMKLNFPVAGKIFIIWPVLWGITLVRFLKNNRKYRKGVPVNQIMKNAGDRGRIVKKLNLFK